MPHAHASCRASPLVRCKTNWPLLSVRFPEAAYSWISSLRSPASAPGQPHDGELQYSRDNIRFTRVIGTGYTGGGGTARQIAESVRDGEGVVVIHGIDYDRNGTYNFSDPQGASELNPGLPAEATDPAACG